MITCNQLCTSIPGWIIPIKNLGLGNFILNQLRISSYPKKKKEKKKKEKRKMKNEKEQKWENSRYTCVILFAVYIYANDS